MKARQAESIAKKSREDSEVDLNLTPRLKLAYLPTKTHLG